MSTFKDMVMSRKKLKEYRSAAVTLADHYLALRNKYKALEDKANRLEADLAAQRITTDRYRTAFLHRMNVPVIGGVWDGNVKED